MNPPGQPTTPASRQTGLMIAAFAWGFAEATFFFIVPDVLLSAIGRRSIRTGLRATMFAILGALLGGLVTYAVACSSPSTARSALLHVPAIHPVLIERVQSQIADHGAIAVLLGPMAGIPYKVYVAEWGAQKGSALILALVSIPARGIRFIFSVVVAGGVARLLAPWTRRRATIEITILVLFWACFYSFYFVHFGW